MARSQDIIFASDKSWTTRPTGIAVSQSSAVFGQSGQSRFKIKLHPDTDTQKDTQRETDESKKE